MTDLSKLGLSPSCETHEDSKIFELVEKSRSLADAYHNNREWHDASAFVAAQKLLARTRATTLLGLLEKAEHALHDWRSKTDDSRFNTVFSGQAAALEQAVELLSLFSEADIQAKLAGRK